MPFASVSPVSSVSALYVMIEPPDRSSPSRMVPDSKIPPKPQESTPQTAIERTRAMQRITSIKRETLTARV